MSALQIRSPRDSELPACRMLLPESSRDPAHHFLVAVVQNAPHIVAAAAWLHIPGAFEAVRVSVVRTRLREGIGSRLMERVFEEASRRDAHRVAGWLDAISEPAAERFAAALGFHRASRVTTYECPAHPFVEHFSGLRRRLLLHGHIPPVARMAPLQEVRRDAVARLWAEHIAGNPGLRADVIEYHLAAGAYAESPVVFSGEQLAGFLLVRYDGSLAVLDAKVVVPRFRGGWAGILLSAAAADQGTRRGIERVAFCWRDGVRHTARIASRFPGKIRALADRYQRAIGTDAFLARIPRPTAT